jgi:hypothetical protein
VSIRTETTYQWTCDRCGYASDTLTTNERPHRFAQVECSGDTTSGGHLCPGCVADFERFLDNQPVEVMGWGDEYRYPEPVT